MCRGEHPQGGAPRVLVNVTGNVPIRARRIPMGHRSPSLHGQIDHGHSLSVVKVDESDVRTLSGPGEPGEVDRFAHVGGRGPRTAHTLRRFISHRSGSSAPTGRAQAGDSQCSQCELVGRGSHSPEASPRRPSRLPEGADPDWAGLDYRAIDCIYGSPMWWEAVRRLSSEDYDRSIEEW